MRRKDTDLADAIIDLDAALQNAITTLEATDATNKGELEGKMLCEYFAKLDRRKICISQIKILNSPTSPYFMVVETK